MIKLNISAKIIIIFLLLALFTFAVVSLFSIAGMEKLKNAAVKNAEMIGSFAVGDSKAALTQQARSELKSIAKDQAYITGLNLSRIASQVNSAAVFTAQEISSAPSPENKEPQVEKNVSAYSFSLAQGVKPEDVKRECAALAGLQQLFSFIISNTPHIRLIYIGTESGVMFKYPNAVTQSGYDPRTRVWYKGASALNDKDSVYWTEPYNSASAEGELTITCSKAVFDSKGNICGVVGADVSVDSITRDFISTQIDRRGSAFLINSRGDIIAKEGMGGYGGEWQKKAELKNMLESPDGDTVELARRMLAMKEGTANAKIDGVQSIIGYAPVPGCGWSIAVVVPEEIALKWAADTEKRIESEKLSALAIFNRLIKENFKIFLMILGGLLIVILIIGYLLAGTITTPIMSLMKGALRIGSGDLDHKISLKTGDEIQTLAATLNNMSASLKEHIHNLNNAVKERQRIESDLKTATEIQTSMLPRKFPAFPERRDIDIFALMEPAKEVGGDLYDFVFVDKDKLYFCIGDVSGKGIPAALFMATTKTLMRGLAMQGASPGEILLKANNYLADDNDACMFVTAFCGILDCSTGIAVCANAGHNPPVIFRKDSSSAFFKMPQGLPLGTLPLPDGAFSERTFTLEPGDSIFTYTDGVTEAMDTAGNLFGEKKMMLALSVSPPNSALLKETIDAVRKSVKTHENGAPQADDVTMLLIKYTGKSV